MMGSPIGIERLGLEGRVCLVTGGTKGIGAAIGREFLAAGSEVIVTARTEDSFTDLAATLGSDRSGKVRFIKADFSQRDSLEGLLTELKALPRLDVLINNAGTNLISSLRELRSEDYDQIQEVDLRAAILLMQTASERMIQGGWGRIVNIASIWSVVTRAGRIAYTAAKSGLVGATRTAAVDLARYGILVNAVSPGFTLTDLTARTLEKSDIQELSSRVPLERFADPAEIAGIVLFLASGWNTYVTGQNITVDGGYSIV